MDGTAKQSGLKLLIGTQSGNIYYRISAGRAVGAIATGTRCGASDQAAVISPVKARPRTPLPGLVLHVGGHIELLVVVNTERPYRAGNRSGSADLRGEEARRYTGKDHER